MREIFISSTPRPATVRALRAAGASHVLAAIRGGAGSELPWGPQGPHGRVFVTRWRDGWGSANTTTVYLDRIPVWRHQERIPHQRPESALWADPELARAERAEKRSAGRAADAAYKAALSAAEAAWLRGEPLEYIQGQEGGTVAPRGGRRVSARGLYARLHGGATPSWAELEAFVASARRGEEAPVETERPGARMMW